MYAFNDSDEARASEAAQAATADVLSRVTPSARSGDDKRRQRHKIDPTVKWDFYGHILADRSLTPGAVRVAYVLLDRYNHDTGECFPGIDTLMADTGLGRTAVLDALHGADKPRTSGCDDKRRTSGLIGRGWFTVRKRRNQSNRYTPNLAKVGLTGRESERLAGFDNLDVRKSELPAPMSDGSGCSEIRTPDVRKSAPGMFGNPNPNPEKITQRRRTHGGETAPPSPNAHARLRDSSAVTPNHRASYWVEPAQVDAWWESFRAAYPNKAGLDRAKGVFCQIVLAKEATAEEIIAGVDRYTEYVDRKHGQHANATAWLTRGRWKEDPELAARQRRETPAPVAPAVVPTPVAAVSKGVEIGPNWRPSSSAWRRAIELTGGNDEAEEILTDFTMHHFRSEPVVDPDDEFLEWCAPF